MINSKLIIPKTVVDRTEGPIVTSNIVLHLDAATYSGGNNWLDLSGRSKHGTINGATFDGDYAFQFDGVNDYISIGALGSSVSQFTIQVWYRVDSFSSGFPNVVDLNSNTYHYNTGPRIGLQSNGNSNWVISGNATDATSFDYININNGASFGVWHNAVLTLNASGQYSSFFNGNPTILNNTNTSGILGVFNDIEIGRGFFNNYGSNYRYFKGKVSKLLIYNVALNSQQILDNHNAINPRFL